MRLNAKPGYASDMRWIYISPHLDDAALSCGGLIWEQARTGIAVEIWSVCAGDPPSGTLSPQAQEMHTRWQSGSPQETLVLRRAEDQNAARRLGAAIQHFPIPDCIYRIGPEGNWLYPDEIFTAPHPAESALVGNLAALLAERLTNYDTLVCPLGLGGHVDHLLTRAAVEKLNRPLWYYADIPYLLRSPLELPEAVHKLTAKNFFISPAGLAAWQEAIAAYPSQLSSLFEDENDMRQRIREYQRQNDGLMLWETI